MSVGGSIDTPTDTEKLLKASDLKTPNVTIIAECPTGTGTAASETVVLRYLNFIGCNRR